MLKRRCKHTKMAMKDWKKVTYQEDKWQRKNDSLEIIQNYDKNGNINYYTIEIYLFETKDKNARWLMSRRFRSKNMALRYAKAFMRAH